MKNSIKATRMQHTSVAKLMPSLVAVFVITSLSVSATANQINPTLKTPAQVEQALTALLDSRDANLRLASYTSKQSSSNSRSIPKQAPVAKVDYSQKSVAELILAGLAITSEAKSELSSPTTQEEPKSVVMTNDYAVEDIVTIEELDAYQAGVTLNADASEFNPIEESVTAFNEINNQILSNDDELAENAIPALPAPIAKKLNKTIEIEATEVATSLAERDIAESEVVAIKLVETDSEDNQLVEFEVAETDLEDSQPIELELAETNLDDSQLVALEVAETDLEDSQLVALELAETDLEDSQLVDLELTETDLEDSQPIELELAETNLDDSQLVDLEVAQTDLEDNQLIELEVAQTDLEDNQPVAIEIAESEVMAFEMAKIEETASIVNVEALAPPLLASVSGYTQTSPGSIYSTTENSPETPQVTDKIGAKVNVAIRSEECPKDFNKISIPVNGKLCQIFAADFPASMILFIPQTPEEVVQYYLASSDSFIKPKKIKKRTMLKSADNNTTLIISEDGSGTQVDILVKSPVS